MTDSSATAVTSHGSAQVSVIHQHRSPTLPDDDMAPVMETTRYATQRNAVQRNLSVLGFHHHHPPPPPTTHRPSARIYPPSVLTVMDLYHVLLPWF